MFLYSVLEEPFRQREKLFLMNPEVGLQASQHLSKLRGIQPYDRKSGFLCQRDPLLAARPARTRNAREIFLWISRVVMTS